MVKIIYCIVKVESRGCKILKTAFKKEGASHDVMSGGEGGRVNVTHKGHTQSSDVPPLLRY